MSAVKDKILSVASELFFQQGYNLTGINQIVSESGVAIASLYKHFPSKTDLLKEYLKSTTGVYFTALQTYLSKIKSPKEKLTAIFDFHIDYQMSTNCGGCNFIKINAEISKNETQVLDLVKKHKNDLYDLVKGLVKGINDSEPSKIKSLTDTIYLLLEGAIVDSTIQKDVHFLSVAKKITKTLI